MRNGPGILLHVHAGSLALRPWRFVAAALVLAFAPVQAQAPADIRIALVIGNAAYPAPAQLANPANDARAMADTLQQLGFSVIELRDGSKARMVEAIAQARERLQDKRGVGLLYYAGHGVQLDFHNFMVPVDARIARAADVAQQTVSLGVVIDAFKSAGTRMNILVLDACRDNPFSDKASAKGLAPMDAPPGTFLAYATAPGNVAADGDEASANGLYTGYLLEELKKPTARIEDVFKRVRYHVLKKSRGRQVPWESTSLEDDFVFNHGVAIAPRPEVADRERSFAQQKAEWDRIKDSDRFDDFHAFLVKYPSGLISDLAQFRLNSLQKIAIVAQADSHGVADLVYSLRDGDRTELIYKNGLTGVVFRTTTSVTKKVGPDLFEDAAPGTGTIVVNQAGFVFKDVFGEYDPPWSVVPGSEFSVGKRASIRSVHTSPGGAKQWMDVDSRIVAREKITTPLGVVDTFKVDVNASFQSGNRTKYSFWFEPGWGYPVRMVIELRERTSGAPTILVREVTARSRRS
ncbi:MAG TPA: caspase family protein [Burkholderiaceae bacterium]|nr:caspase family protein [Burkholderiaceae bacterium]